MGIGRRIRRAVRRVGRTIRGAVGTVKDIAKSAIRGDIRGVVGGLMGAVSKVLDKLPFGNVIKAFAQQILSNPLAMMALGPLAGIGALAQLAGGPAGLAQMVNMFAGTAAMQQPLAAQNLMRIVAHQHAMSMFRR